MTQKFRERVKDTGARPLSLLDQPASPQANRMERRSHRSRRSAANLTI
jgi:hypothetical protein